VELVGGSEEDYYDKIIKQAGENGKQL